MYSGLAIMCAQFAIILGREEALVEGLVVRPEIRKPGDLKGRTIATPRGSTAHFQLLYSLELFQLINSVTVILAKPSELEDLWRAGKIDGAYIWSPVLQRLREAFDARTLLSAAAVSLLGAPSFNGYRLNYQFEHTSSIETL